MVRHGEYGAEDHLTERGRAKIASLAEHLDEIATCRPPGGAVLIFASIARRAVETAEILGARFGVGLEKNRVLWPDPSKPIDSAGILELVKSSADAADVLILVTHGDCLDFFLPYFIKKEFGIPMEPVSIERGEALVIDYPQRSMTHVR